MQHEKCVFSRFFAQMISDNGIKLSSKAIELAKFYNSDEHTNPLYLNKCAQNAKLKIHNFHVKMTIYVAF